MDRCIRVPEKGMVKNVVAGLVEPFKGTIHVLHTCNSLAKVMSNDDPFIVSSLVQNEMHTLPEVVSKA